MNPKRTAILRVARLSTQLRHPLCPQGGVSEEQMSAAWERVAEEIMRLQEGSADPAQPGAAKNLSKEQLAEVIRGVANTLQHMQAAAAPKVQGLTVRPCPAPVLLARMHQTPPHACKCW